jgi:hypothetical protein
MKTHAWTRFSNLKDSKVLPNKRIHCQEYNLRIQTDQIISIQIEIPKISIYYPDSYSSSPQLLELQQ